MSKINIIIPAYNEKFRLPMTLKALADFREGNKKFFSDQEVKVYIVNDGSKDNTAQLAAGTLRELKITGDVLSYEKNQGKGHAVKYGMLNSPKADFYYLADSDLSSPWEVMQQLFNEQKKSPEYDCIIGSRAKKTSHVTTDAKRFYSGRMANIAIKLILGLDFQDTQCGYKLFTDKCLPAFKLQKTNRWGFDFEVLYLLKKLELKTKEVGVQWENKEGSKVKFTDYFDTFRQLIKVRTTRYELPGA